MVYFAAGLFLMTIAITRWCEAGPLSRRCPFCSWGNQDWRK